MRYSSVLIPLVISAILCSGCQTAPISGRKQLVLTPESEEIRLGAEAYAEMLVNEPLSTHRAAIEMVQRVGNRLASVAGRSDFQWEFKLFAGPTMNAFCLPGGKVGIYEGMLTACRNEAGLAVVMSHEVAHALARHGGERMTQSGLAGALGEILSRRTEEMDAEKRQLMLGVYGATAQYGVIYPFSRQQESEADKIGVMLMAKAGYDPSEAPEFWERFSSLSGPKAPQFLSTHPSDLKRASDLRLKMPEALAEYSRSPDQRGLGEPVPEIEIAVTPKTAAAPAGAVVTAFAEGSAAGTTVQKSQKAAAPADPTADPFVECPVQPVSATTSPETSAVKQAAAEEVVTDSQPAATATEERAGHASVQDAVGAQFQLPATGPTPPGGESDANAETQADFGGWRSSTSGS